MNIRRGIVKLAGQTAGTLEETAPGRIRFQYDPSWLRKAGATPVSVTLPMREEPYDSDGLHPFFSNLLPEGWLLEVSSKRLKISKDDAFGPLLAPCQDCIGAAEIEAATAAANPE